MRCAFKRRTLKFLEATIRRDDHADDARAVAETFAAAYKAN